MGRLVMKFGGTSVADIGRIRNVARHVKREVDAGHEVAVVVSAMSGKTNELVEWCREASPMHDAREYDAVVASGEQVTAGPLASALQALGIQARSWQGWQIPILTSDAHASARILEIDGAELINRFKDRKEVAVIAGFQGIGPDKRITSSRGQWTLSKGVWILPTYHPAALLRDPARKREAWADLCLLRDKLAELPEKV